MIRGNWAFFHHEVIPGLDGEPYLVRYRLLMTPWFGFYLHHILRADDARDPHDHPWHFATLILSGEYGEYCVSSLPCGPNFISVPRIPGEIVRKRCHWQHRIDWVPEGGAWTLVWTGRRQREWGFGTVDGWVPWREYLEDHGVEV
jgi:hypothetical protein